VIRRMLWAALVAEGEMPRPIDPVKVFSRIDTGVVDAAAPVIPS
jgi:hypothetical protein